MVILIRRGPEIYTINKEIFSQNCEYNLSTKYAINIDVFIRKKNGSGTPDEKSLLEDIIDLLNEVKYPSREEFRSIGRKHGVIIEGISYKPMPDAITAVVKKALENGLQVEYAYDGVNIGGKGILIEFKHFDPNLMIFMKVFMNKNGKRKHWSGRDIAEAYDEILGEVSKVIGE